MAKKYYLPVVDVKRVSWLNNFAAQLPKHAALLNIDADTVLYVQEAAAYFNQLHNNIFQMKTRLKAMISHRDAHSRGTLQTKVGDAPPLLEIPAMPTSFDKAIFARIKQLVNALRYHPNYTHSIGASLQIVGPEIVATNYREIVPGFKLQLTAQEVLLKWKKKHFSGIDIYLDKGDGKGFEYAGFDAQPPFRYAIKLPPDTQSQTWTFKIIYRLGDEKTGNYSRPVSIVVMKHM